MHSRNTVLTALVLAAVAAPSIYAAPINTPVDSRSLASNGRREMSDADNVYAREDLFARQWQKRRVQPAETELSPANGAPANKGPTKGASPSLAPGGVSNKPAPISDPASSGLPAIGGGATAGEIDEEGPAPFGSTKISPSTTGGTSGKPASASGFPSSEFPDSEIDEEDPEPFGSTKSSLSAAGGTSGNPAFTSGFPSSGFPAVGGGAAATTGSTKSAVGTAGKPSSISGPTSSESGLDDFQEFDDDEESDDESLESTTSSRPGTKGEQKSSNTQSPPLDPDEKYALEMAAAEFWLMVEPSLANDLPASYFLGETDLLGKKIPKKAGSAGSPDPSETSTSGGHGGATAGEGAIEDDGFSTPGAGTKAFPGGLNAKPLPTGAGAGPGLGEGPSASPDDLDAEPVGAGTGSKLPTSSVGVGAFPGSLSAKPPTTGAGTGPGLGEGPSAFPDDLDAEPSTSSKGTGAGPTPVSGSAGSKLPAPGAGPAFGGVGAKSPVTASGASGPVSPAVKPPLAKTKREAVARALQSLARDILVDLDERDLD